MSRNPKADATHIPPTPEALVQAEYNKMNEDEKRRYNLARSQRVEPTGPITGIQYQGPVMRNGIQPPAAPATPATSQPSSPPNERIVVEEDAPTATPSSTGMVAGVCVGLAVAIGVYVGVGKLQSMLRQAYSTPLVQIAP